jgi:hypothetical protein
LQYILRELGVVQYPARLLFKERLRFEQEELRLRAKLEAEVQKKTIHLTCAIEALQAEGN